MRDQRGSLVIESVIYMGFSLLILCQVVNLGAWVLQRDVAHSAVDQGVRAGAREDVDPVPACQARIAQVIQNLGGAGTRASCSADAAEVHAVIDLPLRSWLPGVPDGHSHVAASARLERIR